MASEPSNEADFRLIRNVDFGEGVRVYGFTNLYGCRIGDRSQIGTFVEIQAGAVLGADCKVQSHSFICDGVTLGDRVFIGHGVMFTNDKDPKAVNADGSPQTEADWTMEPVVVEDGATIGSGAVVVGPVRIGAGALVGAGAVVTRDVEPGAVVAGIPARVAARRG